MPDLPYNPIDALELPRYIGSLIRDHADFQNIRYSRARPKERSQVPCITYTLVSRTPGHQGIEKYGARLRGYLPADGDHVVHVHGQLMTCVYQWDCYANTGEEADEVAWKLDWFLHSAVPHLLDRGVIAAVFDEELQEGLLNASRDFEMKSLRWVILLEHLRTKATPVIRNILLRVLSPQLEETETLLRNSGVETADHLAREKISHIICISDYSPSGIAREFDYVEGVDYLVWQDPLRKRTSIQWLEPGKRPADGATYYVRYLYWAPGPTLSVGSQNVYRFPPEILPPYF